MESFAADWNALFPAPAGMIPRRRKKPRRSDSFPRTRGDDPDVVFTGSNKRNFSPHPRG